MIKYYMTQDQTVNEINELSEGCWISVVSPSQKEIDYLIDDLKIEPSFVKAALDDEESSRIEKEDEQILIIVDTPMVVKESQKNTILYTTTPIGIILTKTNIITICHKETPVITELADGIVKNLQTHMKTRFLLMLLLRVAARYLQYLKQIDKISDIIEKQLHKSMKNKELIQLLGLEKSLVYFSTSLKGNEVTMEKILRGRVIPLYEDDHDLLEDVLIEIKQAIEMSNIYSSILSGMMDAFASIISNNLNIVMKVLTSITILMAIPTMVASFFGMNVSGLPLAHIWWFPLAVSGVITAIVAFILIKSNMFSSE